MYDALIMAIRAEIPKPAELVYAKVTEVSTSDERQKLTLSNGETISARLVVLANGLNIGLRRNLGIERQIISACHSISIGFDLEPVGRAAFAFPALTYFSERPSDRIPYLTLFPIGNKMRANLFAYREADDPWLREMRHNPVETMNAALPRLRRITGEYTRFRRRQDQAGRSLCQHRLSPARHRAGRRRVCDHLPGLGHRHRQGAHRRHPALQRPYPGLACDRRHERGQDRVVLRRIRSSRPATPGPRRRRSASARSRWTAASTGRRSAGRASWRGSAKAACGGCARRSARSRTARSLLLVVILIIVVFIVVVGLTGRVVRLVALVVPELAVGAVGGEQLRVRAALDRLAV